MNDNDKYLRSIKQVGNPVNPEGQEQVNRSNSSLHLCLFSHGFDAHPNPSEGKTQIKQFLCVDEYFFFETVHLAVVEDSKFNPRPSSAI